MIPFRSVKFRLTLWYACILTVFLSVFAWFMHAELARTLYRDADKKLLSEATNLADSLRNYLDQNDLAAYLTQNPGIGTHPFHIPQALRAQMDGMVVEWEKKNRRVERCPISVRLLNLDQSVVLTNLSGWEAEVRYPNYERDSVFMEMGESFQTIHFRSNPIRLYYYLIRFKSRPLMILQCSLPIQEVKKTLYRLDLIIWFSVPVAVIAACLAGWFLAKRSFRPVDSMIREARQITAAYLKGRLPRTATGDELDRLAETLNEMMDRIEASTKTIQDFSSDISHELKTPLAIIRGEIDVALRRNRSHEDLKETLITVGGEVNELIRLVDDLMLLLRSDAKQLKYEMNDVFLPELLQQTLQRFQERAQQKNINLSLKMNQDAVIKGDPVYLKRLLGNLVDNAIKFTPEFGNVTLELKVADKEAVVVVMDNGIGMEPEVMSKVFYRFYRADQARAYEGSGLGLNIAKAIADAHQIKIDMVSSPKQGTTISLRFPLK